MKYDLPQMPEADFVELHTFVQACFAQGRQQFHPQLRRITTSREGFLPEHEGYLQDTMALAVCMEGQGDYQANFDIWVSPAYKKVTNQFRMTLAHELTHGYAGLKYGHNAHWRRWYYRVLWHMRQAKFLPGLASIDKVLYDVELLYNQVSMVQGDLLITEAIEKAEKEHEQVLQNYWERLNA